MRKNRYGHRSDMILTLKMMKKTDEFFPPDDMYKSPEIREQVVIEALDMYFKSKGIQV